MNEEFELRKRISDADPARGAPELNQSIVARAAQGKPRRQLGFRGFRLATAGATVAVTALALAITLPAVMTPAPLLRLQVHQPVAKGSAQALTARPAWMNRLCFGQA